MQQSNYHLPLNVISKLDFRQTVSKLNRASESRKIFIWTCHWGKIRTPLATSNSRTTHKLLVWWRARSVSTTWWSLQKKPAENSVGDRWTHVFWLTWKHLHDSNESLRHSSNIISIWALKLQKCQHQTLICVRFVSPLHLNTWLGDLGKKVSSED